MFKSLKELESAMYDILVAFNNDPDINNLASKFKSIDFDTALEECISKNLFRGLKSQRNGNEIMVSTNNPQISSEGLDFIETFHMNFNDLTDIQNQFNLLSDELIDSTEGTFNATLNSLREFCISEKILIDILDPISKINFNSSNNNPKNQNQLLKMSYDILLDKKTNYDTIWRYAFDPHNNIHNIYELFELGKYEIFNRLIKYINLKLSKLIGNIQDPNTSNQTVYNIHGSPNSIIGNSKNATINNGISFDEISKLIQMQNDINSSDKQQLIELVNCLKDLIENKKPVHKGILSKFDDVILKHWPIIQLIGTTLIKSLSNLN